MRIELTTVELLFAAYEGVLRQVRALSRGLEHAAGYDGSDPWLIHIEGAAAERAVAKALGIYWPNSQGPEHGGDLPGEREVRWVKQAHLSLIIRPGDPPERRYYLVSGREGSYTVHGWIFGHEARREEWSKAPNGRSPAWFVPQSVLRPL
jgi:hypothetical protein